MLKKNIKFILSFYVKKYGGVLYKIIKTKFNRFFATKITGFRRLIELKSNKFWFNYPFGEKVQASHEEYLQLASKVKLEEYPQIDDYEKKIGYKVDIKWLDELALHTQVVIKESPLCYAHGRLLYTTLSNYINKQKNLSPVNRITIWETGTARGFSSICMAKALYEHKQAGAILTFDVLPHNIKMYWNCIDDIEGPKTRRELLKPWEFLLENYIIFHQGDTALELQKMRAERIHFAFLDGAHTYDDVMFEFSQIKYFQKSGDIIVYDDYTPQQFPGLVQAVDEICKNYNYKRIDIQAHFGRGYVVAVKE